MSCLTSSTILSPVGPELLCKSCDLLYVPVWITFEYDAGVLIFRLMDKWLVWGSSIALDQVSHEFLVVDRGSTLASSLTKVLTQSLELVVFLSAGFNMAGRSLSQDH